MIIQCEQCSTRYNLDDAKIKSGGVKVRCVKCKHVFRVYPLEEPPQAVLEPEPERLADPAAEAAAPPAAPPPAEADTSPVSPPRPAESEQMSIFGTEAESQEAPWFKEHAAPEESEAPAYTGDTPVFAPPDDDHAATPEAPSQPQEPRSEAPPGAFPDFSGDIDLPANLSQDPGAGENGAPAGDAEQRDSISSFQLEPTEFGPDAFAADETPPAIAMDEPVPEAGPERSYAVPSQPRLMRAFYTILWVVLLGSLVGGGFFLWQRGGFGPQSKITKSDLKGYWVDNKSLGKIFVITGNLTNTSDKRVDAVKVRGTIYNKAGKEVGLLEGIAGKRLPQKMLQALGREEIEENLRIPPGSPEAVLAPGEKKPFMIVFIGEKYGTVEHYSADILN